MTQPKSLSNQQIARAALVVLLGFLASGALGFVRVAIISQQFGAGAALDAFLAAQRIPEMIFVLVAGGALGSSFIPIFAEAREKDAQEAWRLASAVMTLSALAAAVLGILVVLLAQPLMSEVLLRDRPPNQQQLAAALMRIQMLTPCIFAVSGLVMGILQTHGMFVLPSLAISMNNIGIIFGALVLAPLLPPAEGVAQVGVNNVYGLAIGAVLSALLHLVVQLPGLIRLRAPLRPLFDWRIPGVLRVLRLMGPRVLGLAVVQINFVVNIILTSGMIEGSLVALTNAFTLMFTMLGIIAQSVGSAVFPTLSALYAANDLDGYKNRLANALRSVLFLAFPATAAAIVMGEPLVRIFEHGEWTPESTAATAWALAFYATGIAGFALLEVLSRAFYAIADTRTPVVIGIAAMVSNIILSLILVRIIGDPHSLARGAFAGLALANALTTLLEALLLWWLLRRRLGGGQDHFVVAGAWRAALAALVMGVALFLVVNGLPGINNWLLLLACGLVGGGVFFGVSWALGLDEARVVPLMILRRLRRSA
jgi:putative peptidoglycan lipid II flippase